MIEVYRTHEENVDFCLSLRPGARIGSQRHAALDAGVIDDDVEFRHVRLHVPCDRFALIGPADVIDKRLEARHVVLRSLELLCRARPRNQFLASRSEITGGQGRGLFPRFLPLLGRRLA